MSKKKKVKKFDTIYSDFVDELNNKIGDGYVFSVAAVVVVVVCVALYAVWKIFVD